MENLSLTDEEDDSLVNQVDKVDGIKNLELCLVAVFHHRSSYKFSYS